MLVSVALPVYNGLPYLTEAIATILAQDIDFELIVSDDVSSDGSLEIVRNLTDPRVRILPNATNAGIFGNLNRCIVAARGDVIQVFSQDDRMKQGYLASQVRSLQKYPDAGLAYGTPEYIDEMGSPIRPDLRDHTPEYIDPELYLWIASHYGALPASISSIMMPRRTFESVGLFNPDYPVAGDIEFYNRVSARFPMVRNKEVLHAVRSHPRMTSALSTAGPRYLREELALEEWYRSRWNVEDYRKITQFRSALRGRYHLGWIARRALRGKFGEMLGALRQMNRIYPLRWVIWWRVLALLRPGWRPLPRVSPPR